MLGRSSSTSSGSSRSRRAASGVASRVAMPPVRLRRLAPLPAMAASRPVAPGAKVAMIASGAAVVSAAAKRREQFAAQRRVELAQHVARAPHRGVRHVRQRPESGEALARRFQQHDVTRTFDQAQAIVEGRVLARAQRHQQGRLLRRGVQPARRSPRRAHPRGRRRGSPRARPEPARRSAPGICARSPRTTSPPQPAYWFESLFR